MDREKFVRYLQAFKKVYEDGRRLVDNSKTGCDRCKIMNITDTPFREKTFNSDMY